MKRLLLAALLFAVPALAQQGSSTLWERCLFGGIPGCQFIELRGYLAAVAGTARAVWPDASAYTPLAAAMSTPYCASDNAADAAAGTGARTIAVSGIDTSYAAFTETVTLNGTTSVNLATANVMLINSLEVLTAGSGLTNAGIVQCGTGVNTAGDPAVSHAYIITGRSRSMQAWYGVPTGYSLICKNWTAQSFGVTAAQTVQFLLNQTINKVLTKQDYLAFLNQAGSSTVTLPNEILFQGSTIVRVDALSAASTGPVALRADCLLFKNDFVTGGQTIF
jgi:hypothetical protein